MSVQRPYRELLPNRVSDGDALQTEIALGGNGWQREATGERTLAHHDRGWPSRLLIRLIFAASGLMLQGAILATPAKAGSPSVVHFDAPTMVAGETLVDQRYQPSLPGNRLVWIRLPLTASLAGPDTQVGEISYTIRSLQHSMRVVDFWPRREFSSTIDGVVQVSEQDRRNQDLAFHAAGGTPGVGGGQATGSLSRQIDQTQTYLKKPAQHLVTASGTADRGFGVYFKIRPSTDFFLEGEREYWVLWEVSEAWRADLVEIRCEALAPNRGGFPGSDSKVKSLGQGRFLVAMYSSGDRAAAALAESYVQREQKLRWIAAAKEQEIRRNRFPTVLHKIGSELEIVEPEIPEGWLEQIVFGAAQRYIDQRLESLPVDVRVAILDYLDQRQAMAQFANIAAPTKVSMTR